VGGLRHRFLAQLGSVGALYAAMLLASIALSFLLVTHGDGSLIQTAGLLLVSSLVVNGILIIRNHALRREAARRAEAESKLALTLDTMRDGIVAFDGQQHLVVANRRYQEIYALPADVVRQGTPFARVIDTLRERQPAIPPTEQFIKDFLVRLNKGDPSPILVQTQNRVVAVSFRVRPGGGWVSTHEDVTQRTQLEKRLNHLALHDALTDLANRVLLYQRLDQALEATGRDNDLAVLCLDLDRFKAVNDTLGHPAGDELLKQVALRLRACVEETDTVARIGGDEFAILQFGPQPGSSARLATQIIAALTAPYTIEEHNVGIGTSIGIAIPPEHGSQTSQLIKRADLALYIAKAEGGGTYRLFEDSMERRSHERRSHERRSHERRQSAHGKAGGA
jgi:diguanylate cyclase (GGDEF)-like protein